MGNPLANLLYGMRGNDSIDGAAGVDTAGFMAPHAQATITANAGGWTVTSARDGTDTLAAVERLRFADVSVALDISSGGVLGAGNAGVAAKAVNALLGKAFVSDKNLMGAVLDLLDQGMSHAELVNLGVNHPLFASLAGAGAGPVNATQFVRHVYFNVVGQYPDPDALAYYAGILSRGEMTQGRLGLLASDTDINASTVNLAGLSSTGLEYFAFG